jgi:hypothetical protein
MTWMQDANYAYTSGYHATGRMTLAEGTNFIENLVYQGYTDWVLPDMAGKTSNGLVVGIWKTVQMAVWVIYFTMKLLI